MTGINRFSLYKEFGGKQGLFEEALTLYAREAGEHYERLLGKQPQGLNNILEYFDAIVIPSDYHGCMMVNTVTDKAVLPQSAYEIARAFVDSARGHFLSNLSAAVAAGELPEETDLQVMADVLTTMDNGIAVFGGVYPDQNRAALISRTVLLKILNLRPDEADASKVVVQD